MESKRPDLSNVDPEVLAYIEELEQKLLQMQSEPVASARNDSAETQEPSEPPTPYNVITISTSNIAKRTPRHHYLRQRRGGMGIFDIETDEEDPPALLAVADEDADMILVTDQGRVFRLPVKSIPATSIRARGESLSRKMQLLANERVVALLPADAGLYITLISQRGWVRHVRNTYLGKHMIQGIRYHKVSEGGYITGACWGDGNGDIFIATRAGLGIRFSERQIPGSGCLGLRVAPDDEAIAVTATAEDGALFLLNAEGKGTIRLMEGFRKNKAPGAGGKVAMKTNELVGAMRVQPTDDVLVISRLSKIIRFSADEIPQKTGVVQGVNCMSLRADEAVAFVVTATAANEPPA